MDAGVLLLHGLFEHKGRHQINSDWFENLSISPYTIDLLDMVKNQQLRAILIRGMKIMKH